ncbi:MAG TPA: hypothetical protein VHY21_04355, partial [Pseudonocardiaceae bacterium]|nr:hypothetical protein [Pseudonocardiaceae bacterium]
LCVLVSLVDALRRREIYVAGAARWRNPEEDLPADFEDNRDVHYRDLRQPLDAGEFIASIQELMRRRTAELATAIEKNRSGGVKVKTVRGEYRWHVPELGKLPVPANLAALHAEVARRGGRSSCWTSSRKPTSTPASPTRSPRWPLARRPRGR